MAREVSYSFKQWCLDNGHQDWLDLWDYDRNQFGPDEIAPCSNKKCYFRCKNGLHESEQKTIQNLSKGRSSVFCKKCKSFGSYMDLMYGVVWKDIYWSEKNTIDWYDVSRGTSRVRLWFKCEHNSLHPDYSSTPYHFSAGGRCPVCANRKIIAGVNDINTTAPELTKYFKHPDDAKHVSRHCARNVWFKCPLCGAERFSSPDIVFGRETYSCQVCGDGLSFGNKFVSRFLGYLCKVHGYIMEREKTFPWSRMVGAKGSRRIYDFYLSGTEEIIVEVHGEQHYKESAFSRKRHRTLEEEQENDTFKMKLALQNGINPRNYIVLDCSKSEESYIISSIMSSNLPKIFHFERDDIDWHSCTEFAFDNTTKIVSDLWKGGVHNVTKIAEMTGFSKSAVSIKLRKAEDLGWIVYDNAGRKPVVCLDTGAIFENCSVCSALSLDLYGVHLSAKMIGANARHEINSTHGHKFAYIPLQEYLDIKEKQPDKIYFKE